MGHYSASHWSQSKRKIQEISQAIYSHVSQCIVWTSRICSLLFCLLQDWVFLLVLQFSSLLKNLFISTSYGVSESSSVFCWQNRLHLDYIFLFWQISHVHQFARRNDASGWLDTFHFEFAVKHFLFILSFFTFSFAITTLCWKRKRFVLHVCTVMLYHLSHVCKNKITTNVKTSSQVTNNHATPSKCWVTNL